MDRVLADSHAEIRVDRHGNDERSDFPVRRGRQTHGPRSQWPDQLEELFRRCGDYGREWPDQCRRKQGKRENSYGERADLGGTRRENVERHGAYRRCEERSFDADGAKRVSVQLRGGIDELRAGELQGDHLRQCAQDLGRRASAHRIWERASDDPAVYGEWAGFRSGVERKTLSGQEFAFQSWTSKSKTIQDGRAAAVADKIWRIQL